MATASRWMLAVAALGLGGCYQQAFRKTPVGEFELKELPPATVMATSSDGGYYKNSGTLFRRLFRYIQKNKVPMSVPVEGHDKEGRMTFYLGQQERAKELKDAGAVKVIQLPARMVASHGVRGAYSRSNYLEALGRLREWCGKTSRVTVTGDPYVVFWNSPFVLDFWKRSEVHLPVTGTGQPADK